MEGAIHYHTPQVYALRDWISMDRIEWATFCKNPLVIFFLKKHPEYFEEIHWWMLSKNPNAMDFLLEHQEHIEWNQLCLNTHIDAISLLWFKKQRINWSLLSTNPSALFLLEKNPHKIEWAALTHNPQALDLLPLIDQEKYNISPSYPYWGTVDWEFARWRFMSKNPLTAETFVLLESNLDKVSWYYLCKNKTPKAMHLLEKHIDRVNWRLLCKNPLAISMIEKRLATHPQDMDWKSISRNPAAISLLKKHPNKIDWSYLSKNPHPDVLPLLQENQEKINWEHFSSNPNMFSYDYPFLREHMNIFKEELIAAAFHPTRIARILERTDGELEGFI